MGEKKDLNFIRSGKNKIYPQEDRIRKLTVKSRSDSKAAGRKMKDNLKYEKEDERNGEERIERLIMSIFSVLEVFFRYTQNRIN